MHPDCLILRGRGQQKSRPALVPEGGRGKAQRAVRGGAPDKRCNAGSPPFRVQPFGPGRFAGPLVVAGSLLGPIQRLAGV